MLEEKETEMKAVFLGDEDLASYDSEELKDYVILTEYATGLQQEHVEEAIRILEGADNGI